MRASCRPLGVMMRRDENGRIGPSSENARKHRSGAGRGLDKEGVYIWSLPVYREGGGGGAGRHRAPESSMVRVAASCVEQSNRALPTPAEHVTSIYFFNCQA